MEKNAGIYFVAMNIFGIYQVVCCNKRVNKLYACRGLNVDFGGR